MDSSGMAHAFGTVLKIIGIALVVACVAVFSLGWFIGSLFR